MEFTLLFSAATGLAGVWIANRLLSENRPTWLEKPTDLLLGSAAVGMLVGRLAAMIGAGINPLTNPADILLVRGGVSTGFASLGALGTLAWSMRHHLPTAFDLLAPAALAGLAGWHAGCVWRSACFGTASELPWAMTAPGSSVGRHPVEIYAAIAFVIAAWLVARLPLQALLPTGAALTLAGAIRLLTQPFRVSIVGGPVEVYVAGIVIGVIAIAASVRRSQKSERESDPTARAVFDGDGSAVGLDDAPSNRQPET
jgi:prolipoprotein diacylglyceryltransferase